VPTAPPAITLDVCDPVKAALDAQLRLVAEVHDDVAHAPSESATLALVSKTPKPRPVTVTELPPLKALFNSPYEPTAASKLYTALAVPAMPPTLTADMPYIVLAVLLTHTSVVPELQDDVPHIADSMTAVTLRSTEPKLSPLTVTELPPLEAPFCTQLDPTAASKLYAALAVPATLPTLTADMPYILVAVLLRHASAVPELHDDVLHATISSAVVALRSTEPKPSPLTVAELPPLEAPFRTQPDPTAASKLYPSNCVPVGPPTVTATLDVCAAGTATALDAHPKLVAELHDEVSHAP
jgi:hypothetical protein